jgi:hypothetical protein
MHSSLCCSDKRFGFMMSNQFIALAAATMSLSTVLVNSPRTIDHARALSGNVTPFDAPGYPVTISQPGSYRLSSDLVVPAHADGIVITAPNVTLDLNGHSVSGPVRCVHSEARRAVECDWLVEASPRAGINTVAAPNSVVRDGTVKGFAGAGIRHGDAAVIENLEVHSNAGVGILDAAQSQAGVVRHVLVRHNGGNGIVCDAMAIERSSFAENGGTGVDCPRATFSDSVSRGNGAYGVTASLKPGLRLFHNRQGAVAGAGALREPAAGGSR